jgi:hypothetical protein
MSSETERITNEVLNRHPWDKLEDRLGEACFDDAEGKPSSTDELRDPNAEFTGTGEAVLDLPQESG